MPWDGPKIIGRETDLRGFPRDPSGSQRTHAIVHVGRQSGLDVGRENPLELVACLSAETAICRHSPPLDCNTQMVSHTRHIMIEISLQWSNGCMCALDNIIQFMHVI